MILCLALLGDVAAALALIHSILLTGSTLNVSNLPVLPGKTVLAGRWFFCSFGPPIVSFPSPRLLSDLSLAALFFYLVSSSAAGLSRRHFHVIRHPPCLAVSGHSYDIVRSPVMLPYHRVLFLKAIQILQGFHLFNFNTHFCSYGTLKTMYAAREYPLELSPRVGPVRFRHTYKFD